MLYADPKVIIKLVYVFWLDIRYTLHIRALVTLRFIVLNFSLEKLLN